VSLGLQLRPERAFLRQRSAVAISDLPGFVRGRHRLPTEHGRAAEQFVHTLAEQLLADEVREVYERAKRTLGLRRRELVRAIAEGGGNVEAPQFQFALELGLDPHDCTRARWQRRVLLLRSPHALPDGFDELFPVACDELVVPFADVPGGVADTFDAIVERLEDFAERWGGDVDEDEASARASLRTRDGSRITLDLRAHELSLRLLGVSGCRALLLEAARRHAELADPIVAALAR
jgi:hypothetical protein